MFDLWVLFIKNLTGEEFDVLEILIGENLCELNGEGVRTRLRYNKDGDADVDLKGLRLWLRTPKSTIRNNFLNQLSHYEEMQTMPPPYMNITTRAKMEPRVKPTPTKQNKTTICSNLNISIYLYKYNNINTIKYQSILLNTNKIKKASNKYKIKVLYKYH